MSDGGMLRQKVREALETGRLPDRSPARTWGGPGCGATCAICGERIDSDEVEFELEFSTGGEPCPGAAQGNGLNGAHPGNGHTSDNGHGRHHPGAKDTLHVHLRCHAAWDLARQESDQAQRLMSPLPGAERSGTIDSREGDTGDERGPA